MPSAPAMQHYSQGPPAADPSGALASEAAGKRGLHALMAVTLAVYPFLTLMAYLEPITGDGWYVSTDYARQGASLSVVFHRMALNHVLSNPRLGELFTLYSYVPGVHVVMTPLIELLMIVMIFVHATGRLPRATPCDATLLLNATALCWLTAPAPGQTFFYRPITTNYVYSFALVLLYFLPFRLGARARGPLHAALLALGMFVAGFAVGMFNEHTGPAVILAAATYAILAARRRAFLDLTWTASATTGLMLGYAYLFSAPGLGRRVGHVKHSVLDTVLMRGVDGNLEILGAFVTYIAPLLVAFAVLTVAAGGPKQVRAVLAEPAARVRLRGMAAYVVLGLLILGISLASPRSHYRLAIAPAMLFVIAALGVIELFWDRPRVRRDGTIGALAAAVMFAATFIRLYSGLHSDDLQRISLAEHTPPGMVLYVPRMSNGGASPLFYGDTLPIDHRHRVRMAKLYHLAEVRIGNPRRVAARSREKTEKAKKKKPTQE